MNMTFYMLRQPRRPITWVTAFSSLGLALLAGSAATSSAAPPNKSQAVAQSLADLKEAQQGTGAPDSDDTAEPAGRVRISRDMPDMSSSRPGTVHLQDIPRSRPPSSSVVANARTQRAAAARKATPPTRASSVIQKPLLGSAATSRPAWPQYDAAPNVASKSASKIQPVQHLSSRPAPSLDDDEETVANDAIDNEVSLADIPAVEIPVGESDADESSFVQGVPEALDAPEAGNPATAFLEEENEANSAAAVTQSSGDVCPPSDEKIEILVSRVEQETARKPIGKLRADMQMRLPNEHSMLWKPVDQSDESKRAATRERVLTHENVRCSVESERQAIRDHFNAAFGPFVDRSTGGGSDEAVAPVFPYTYHPLYFEDPNLERCGYSMGTFVQPFASGIHFYANVALWPVKMLMIQPLACVYPQEDCEPCTRYSYIDNLLGPYPETMGWGLFRSRCNSCNNR